jgi:hypothetical protein
LHSNISNNLYKNLNKNQRLHPHFRDFNSNECEEKDSHIFRSFRLLGLRHLINRSESTESNIRLDPFSEFIEIRCAFDIKQFNSRNAYDCFIECEVSYYKVVPDNLTLSELTWFNYLNNINFDSDKRRKHCGSKCFDKYTNLDKIDELENYENIMYNSDTDQYFIRKK